MKKLFLLVAFAFISWSAGAQTQLWSMTPFGGVNNLGTIFKINPDGSGYTNVYSFDTVSGYYPCGSLLYANNGKLYGMNLMGTVFSFNPSSNVYSILLTSVYFVNNSPYNTYIGRSPNGDLIQAANGKLYGLTSSGGYYDQGEIFYYDFNTSTDSTLYSFDGLGAYSPLGSLVEASNGKLYGISFTHSGIFEFDPALDSLIFHQSGTGLGTGNLIQATNGLLYGMAFGGGNGFIYNFNTVSNIVTPLYSFDSINGKSPQGSLIQATDGKLYGLTMYGGVYNDGVIFQFDISSNTIHKLYDFNYLDGAYPGGSLFQASNGKLYGMTGAGGLDSAGVIFSYDISTSAYTKLRDLNRAIGDGANNGKDSFAYQHSAFIELPANVGISEYSHPSTISLSPNPATTTVTISISSFTVNQQLIITDMLGREIYKSLILNPQSIINVSQWNNGVYFYQLINDTETKAGKFVVSH